jgi:CheY-like chemotaxis protein
LSNQSTAHGVRVGACSRAATEWLGLAGQLAPAGFDARSDGLCIHRGGTVVYLAAPLRTLLGLSSDDAGVGGTLLELFSPADRLRVGLALARAEGQPPSGATWLTLNGAPGVPRTVGLTTRRVSSTVPPLELLYVQSAPAAKALVGAGERALAATGERTGGREDVPNGSLGPFGQARRAPASSPAVLICDDEARLGALTAGLLADYGFVPVTVGTGEAALDAIAARSPRFDVMLLDVNLSQGSSAHQVLRTLSGLAGAPRVVLTSGLAEEDVDGDLMQHPLVSGYVPKPYAVDDLVQSLERALRAPPG